MIITVDILYLSVQFLLQQFLYPSMFTWHERGPIIHLTDDRDIQIETTNSPHPSLFIALYVSWSPLKGSWFTARNSVTSVIADRSYLLCCSWSVLISVEISLLAWIVVIPCSSTWPQQVRCSLDAACLFSPFPFSIACMFPVVETNYIQSLITVSGSLKHSAWLAVCSIRMNWVLQPGKASKPGTAEWPFFPREKARRKALHESSLGIFRAQVSKLNGLFLAAVMLLWTSVLLLSTSSLTFLPCRRITLLGAAPCAT